MGGAMRRNRRGHSGMEFGGSGEDSFVAVVVTKLTGALLFILLLTMVIMALLPKAIDLPSSPGKGSPGTEADLPKLSVTTPEELPEAIAGRPYHLALAADGGRGDLRWSLAGPLPEGLAFEPESGLIRGTPSRGTPEPIMLTASVTDGSARASKVARLVVYQPDGVLSMPSKWKPSLPPIPVRDWLNQGFGFLVLWLVYLVGLNTLNGLKHRALSDALDGDESRSIGRRFLAYKLVLALMSLGATVGLAVWLWWPR
jgi:hypothetical protein